MNRRPLSEQKGTYVDVPRRSFHLIPESEYETVSPKPHAQTQLLERKLLLDQGISLEKKQEKIRQAVMEAMKPKPLPPGPYDPNSSQVAESDRDYPYVKETRETHVIVEKGVKLYAVPYKCTADGDVTLGKPKRIRPAYVNLDD